MFQMQLRHLKEAKTSRCQQHIARAADVRQTCLHEVTHEYLPKSLELGIGSQTIGRHLALVPNAKETLNSVGIAAVLTFIRYRKKLLHS